MSEHKFEAGQLVLARYNVGGGPKWSLQHFSHVNSGDYPFNTITGYSFSQCIPYTPETAHLLGTNAPYEPPKPPHEYKWGDKVAVRNADGKWNEAVFINFDPEDFFPFAVMIKGHISLEYFQKENIRPLEPSDE